jgi:signal transduction histidine kinase
MRAQRRLSDNGSVDDRTSVKDSLRGRIEAMQAALARANDERRWAECSSRIQSDAMQRALDLLVREPDINGFFRLFIQSIVEECEAYACGVWLLDDASAFARASAGQVATPKASGGQLASATGSANCHLWMVFTGDKHLTSDSEEWQALSLPREELTRHLLDATDGWTRAIAYTGDDERLPESVRERHRATGVASLITAPLALPTHNLGWVVLSATSSSSCESQWRKAVLEAMARQATLALHQSRLAEQSRNEARRQAVLEERNGIARDIHDTLAQGFAAILMQLQAAQRSSAPLPSDVARALDTAVELARTHMVEARRSVRALRPHSGGDEDIAAALQRMTELARRTTDVPIELAIEPLPPLGGGIERDIIGIAQEALTNAVRHAKADRITVQASAVRAGGLRVAVADNGRGITRERQDTGFGMTSMQERAERIGASLTIVTAPRKGTEVVLAWEPPSFVIPSISRSTTHA